MEETERLNIEILNLSKELVLENTEVVRNNSKMAIEEHEAKMDLFDLQRMKLEQEVANEPLPLRDVSIFHKVFGHPVKECPVLPSKKRSTLRVSLIQEELNELTVALLEGNLLEVADALADLQYVLSGAILECGLGDNFRAIFEEVQRSNMSKACKTMEEAQRTVDHYKMNKDTDAYFEHVIPENAADRAFIVYRKSDDKVLKSIDYSPANLKPFI